VGELPDEKVVRRLAGPSERFVSDCPKALPSDFEPSSKDKAHTPVLVSVWDVALTTLQQAESLSPPAKRLSFLVNVTEVRALKGPNVYYDTYVPPTGAPAVSPRTGGHAGISGLERGARTRPEWRDLLARMSELAKFEPESRTLFCPSA